MQARIGVATLAIAAVAAASTATAPVPAEARTVVHEADANLAISTVVRDLLTDAGVTVHMTRERDETLKPWQRTSLANRKQVDAFISIHNNASTSRRPSGTIVFRSLRTGGSIVLGDAIRDAFRAEFGPRRRAQLTTRRGCCGDYYYHLRWTRMPAVLVEAAFVSNPAEGRALATDPEFRRRLAESIARGILDFQPTINAGASRLLDPGVVVPASHLPAFDVAAEPLGATRVRLDWLAPDAGAKRFRIYRDGDLIGDVRVAPGARGSWIDATATPDTVHRYEIRATERAVDAGVKVFRESTAVPILTRTPAMSVVLDPGHGGRDPGAVRTYR